MSSPEQTGQTSAEMSRIASSNANKSAAAPSPAAQPLSYGRGNRRRHFVPNACQFCLRTEDADVVLRVCSKCKIVAYCCVEHQRADWRHHKPLCKVFSTVQSDPPPLPPLTGATEMDWYASREALLQRIEKLALTSSTGASPVFVREMCMYGRHCEVCHRADRESLISCPHCRMVDYCCKEHMSQHEQQHMRECPRLLFALRCMQVSRAYDMPPVWLSPLQVPQYQPLPPDWIPFLAMRGMPALPAAELALVTEVLSLPLTILYALERIPIETSSGVKPLHELTELVIHILWSTQMQELLAATKYEEIFHLLPNLRSLVVVVMGRELICTDMLSEEHLLCENCLKAGRRLSFVIFPHGYVGFWRTWTDDMPGGKKPHLAVVFNNKNFAKPARPSRYGVESEAMDPTFDPVIDHLVSHNITTLVTARHSAGIEATCNSLTQAHSARLLLPVQPNPFAGLVPRRVLHPIDAGFNKVDYSNQYLVCVRGRVANGTPFYEKDHQPLPKETLEILQQLDPEAWSKRALPGERSSSARPSSGDDGDASSTATATVSSNLRDLMFNDEYFIEPLRQRFSRQRQTGSSVSSASSVPSVSSSRAGAQNASSLLSSRLAATLARAPVDEDDGSGSEARDENDDDVSDHGEASDDEYEDCSDDDYDDVEDLDYEDDEDEYEDLGDSASGRLPRPMGGMLLTATLDPEGGMTPVASQSVDVDYHMLASLLSRPDAARALQDESIASLSETLLQQFLRMTTNDSDDELPDILEPEIEYLLAGKGDHSYLSGDSFY